MPSRKIEDCVPYLQESWAYGQSEFKKRHPDLPQPFLTCTFRSVAEQEKLYAQGRTLPGKIVTRAKPGQSKHNKRPSEAYDIAFKKGSKIDWTPRHFELFWDIVKEKFPRMRWGGNFSFKDLPHFEV